LNQRTTDFWLGPVGAEPTKRLLLRQLLPARNLEVLPCHILEVGGLNRVNRTGG